MKTPPNVRLLNTFLKVVVNGNPQRVYFRDVSMYRKVRVRRTPSIPRYLEMGE